MTKDIIVSLKGLQMTPDEQSDTTEMIAPGEYYKRNGKHFVLYNEVVEGEKEAVKCMIKFAEDYLEVTRKGQMNVHMIFEKDKKNLTYYHTPFGDLQIGIGASNITVTESDSEIEINVLYALDVNFEHVADCDIRIVIKEKGMSIDLR